MSICVQDRLKTVPGLSSEIGDVFCHRKTGTTEKSFNLVEKQSNLLAKYIKTAQKKTDLFLSRLNEIVLEGMNQYKILILK